MVPEESVLEEEEERKTESSVHSEDYMKYILYTNQS